MNVLGSVGSVVHHQQLNVLGVADEEGLVAGGHHVTGLLVGTIANLRRSQQPIPFKRKRRSPYVERSLE